MTQILSLLLPGFVLAAAIHDLRSFKIPNGLVAIMLAVWPLAILLSGVEIGIALQTALAALVILLVGIGMFARGWIGGGDVKLISATTLYVGFGSLAVFSMATALAGAAFAIALIMFRKVPLPQPLAAQGWLTELHARTRAMPYGVAIAAGALFVWAEGAALIG